MTEDELRAANKIPPKRSVIVGSTLLVKNPDSGDIAISEKDSSMRLTPLPTTRRITYRVRSGDTISGIAKRFGVKASAIRRDNRLKSDRLKIGQRLRLTIHEVERTRIIKTVYRVKPGDTLYTIANRYKTKVSAIIDENELTSQTLRQGQRLVIPH